MFWKTEEFVIYTQQKLFFFKFISVAGKNAATCSIFKPSQVDSLKKEVGQSGLKVSSLTKNLKQDPKKAAT